MKRTRHTLIMAEIIGFFLIIVGVLGLLTGRKVFVIISIMLFGFVIASAALFAVFATLAVKEHKNKIAANKKK